jgi:hypothetical protein
VDRRTVDRATSQAAVDNSRVCKALFADPKARSEVRFRYAGAERMENPLAGAYAKRYSRTLRHGVKSAFGMPARSAFKPTGGNPLAGWVVFYLWI